MLQPGETDSVWDQAWELQAQLGATRLWVDQQSDRESPELWAREWRAGDSQATTAGVVQRDRG